MSQPTASSVECESALCLVTPLEKVIVALEGNQRRRCSICGQRARHGSKRCPLSETHTDAPERPKKEGMIFACRTDHR
jgi:hypothetical protein